MSLLTQRVSLPPSLSLSLCLVGPRVDHHRDGDGRRAVDERALSCRVVSFVSERVEEKREEREKKSGDGDGSG